MPVTRDKTPLQRLAATRPWGMVTKKARQDWLPCSDEHFHRRSGLAPICTVPGVPVPLSATTSAWLPSRCVMLHSPRTRPL